MVSHPQLHMQYVMCIALLLYKLTKVSATNATALCCTFACLSKHCVVQQLWQAYAQELRGMRLAEPGVVDESSVVCQWCGGIVSRSREAAHQQFWCQANRQ